jgi:hypothetical protein
MRLYVAMLIRNTGKEKLPLGTAGLRNRLPLVPPLQITDMFCKTRQGWLRNLQEIDICSKCYREHTAAATTVPTDEIKKKVRLFATGRAAASSRAHSIPWRTTRKEGQDRVCCRRHRAIRIRWCC